MQPATLIYDRKLLLAAGTILQIRIWQLPAVSGERPHRLKNSLFYGGPGEPIIACDNEAGKGDHRHYREKEEPYIFETLAKLLSDFEADVRREIEHERS